MLKLLARTPQDMRIIRGPFKGARMFLNPSNSKRKIFGLYEYILNEWLAAVAPGKDFAFDVGANSGYDTYGLAHLISHANTRPVDIVAFEPEAEKFPELLTPRQWEDYSSCKIEILPKLAGNEDTETTISLDRCMELRPHLNGKSGLIKIDVEGAEIDVLKGATSMLRDTRHDWVIEIHGEHLITETARFFCDLNRPFLIRNLPPLPILGKERRVINCYWLTTVPQAK